MSTFSIKNFSKQRYFYQLSLFRYIIQSYSVLLTILMQITNEILFLISFQPLNRKMESKKIMKTKALLQLQNPDSEEELTDSLFRATQFFSKFSSSFQIYISSRDHSIQAMIESLVDTSIYMLLLISIKDPSKLFHFASPRIQNQHSFMLVTSPRKGGRQSVKIHSEFSKWIFFSLITNKCDSIKKSVFRFIKFFSSQENSHENKKETHDEMKNSKLRRLFFDQIFEFLPYVWKYKTTIHEYFHLLLDLVKTETKRLISTHQILILNQKKNIYYQVSNQIRKFLAKKFTDPKFEIVVGLLIKLLKLLFIFETEKRKVFSDSDKSNDFYLETESLVGELVDAFLLVFHEDFPRKMCKKLFLEIMKQDQKLSFKILSSCFNKLDPFVNQIKKNYRIQDKFSFTEDANADGYVGLENIGSTCYANSVLQQLFGIQFFRETILSINTEELLKSQQQTDDEQDDAIPVLFELKKIFQGLQRKEDKSQSTFEFCQTFKNIDGNPIKAGKQEDAIEFLHNLFDKIARALKNTENYDLLQKLFEVELVNHFICNEKRHKINHIEKELSVSVEVKHKTNLIESLEHYVEGEFMKAENQFYCSKCEKKVDALKKIYFGSLPKILIIHLKRFEYNPQNGSRTKVDSEFEFPVELDMSKFTLEEKERQTKIKTKQIQIQIENHENQNQNENQKNNGNQNEKCKTIKHSPDYFHYHLVGVVVHNGNLNQGHYISYIQENQTEKLYNFNIQENQTEKLYNFNTQENLAEIYQNNTSDHEQSEDDAEDIDEISVDPEYPIPKWHKFDDRKVDIFDTSELPKMAFGGKPFSAYLLFYERDSCTEEETKETFNENEKQTEIVKKIENPNSEQTNGNPEDLVLNSSQENINSLENISEFDLIGTRESGDSFSDAVVDSYSPPTDINDQFIDFCSRILDGIYNKKEGVLSDWDDEVMKLIIHSIFRVVVFVPAKMQLFDWDQKIQSIFQKSKSLFKWLISELKDPVCPISINRLINDDILSDKQKFETYNLLQTIFKGVNSMQENENFGKEFIQQNNLFFQGFIKYLVDNMKTFSISWSIFLNYLRLLIYIISVNPQIPLTLLEMKLHKKMIDFFPKITNLSNENTLIPVEKLSPNLQEEEEKKEIFLEQENFQFISTFFKLLQYLILEILQLNIDQEIEDLLRIFKDNLASFVFLSKDPKISGIIDSFFTSICSRNRNFIFFFLIVCVERISQNQNTIPNVEMILRILSIPHIDQEKYIEFAIKKIQELVVSKSLIDYQVQKIQNRIAKARISNRVLNDWLIKNFQSKSKENLD
ncbi:ubiquitin carboxyl-terminal hydrolase [Anaeramoeba ignava]|uniref:Ubiquitin carboxyl-terminal hydrolase n=1 Tax=Anaeramoeba ignava TaxID=1746090 RepID=A0A9Q0LUI7_ANAIG|nr:ubiquitin carboxyl-terminal hydrolase [Anaeramoeba ignava]